MAPIFTGSKFNFFRNGLNYIFAPADSSFSDTSLLLHMNGPNNSTTFTDSGNNALTITSSGGAIISTTQNKFGGASGFFNGSTSTLTVPTASGAFNMGFLDHTIEAWIYLTNTTGNKTIASLWPGSDSIGSFRFRVSDATLVYTLGTPQGTVNATSSICLTANNWIHVAAVRNGGTFTLYCNGVSVGTLNMGSALRNAQGNLDIGRSGGVWYFSGYMDEVRITKGVARYTSNFTPPTAPFPDILPISVLFGSNKYGVSLGGTSTITFYFSYVPVDFDLSDIVTNGGILSDLTSTASPFIYTATFVITSNTPNGTATISVDANKFTQSRGIANIASSFSFPINSVDSNFSNVSLLLHMEGANNSTTFTDSSSNALTVTAVGNAKISTVKSKFGNTSGYFDGTGSDALATNSYLTVPTSSGVFNFGTGNYTIESWIYLRNTSGNKVIATIWPGPSDSQASFRFRVSNATLVFNSWGTGTTELTSSNCLVANTWHHVAAVKNGSTLTLYCDGVSVGSSSVGSPRNAQGNLIIGQSSGTNTWYFDGYMDELRITKGVARYTSNFTVPSAAFPNP